jgi:hypothetical protein
LSEKFSYEYPENASPSSQATGMSEFTPAGGGIEYTVDASNIQGVTARHIHSGKQGENGPVIVTLLKNESSTNEV